MMGVFLAGMGVLVCIVSYLQLRWIHQQVQGFFYRCLQVLLVIGDGILFYRFSNQFYRLLYAHYFCLYQQLCWYGSYYLPSCRGLPFC